MDVTRSVGRYTLHTYLNGFRSDLGCELEKKDLDNLYAIIEHLFVLVFVHYSGHSHIFCESCHQCRDSVTRHNGLHGPKRMCECL